MMTKCAKHSAELFAKSSTELEMQLLEQQLIEQCEICFQMAEARLNKQFPRPEINFKLKGRSAGTAHLQQNLLRFNAVLYQQNTQAFLAQVVPHEIAHLLCFQLYGKVKPHGKEWQQLMWHVFKVKPKTTHDFDVSVVKAKTVSYQCQCGVIELSIRRHNKVQRGQAKYLCRRCHEELTFIS